MTVHSLPSLTILTSLGLGLGASSNRATTTGEPQRMSPARSQGRIQVDDLGSPDTPSPATRQARKLRADDRVLMTIEVRDQDEKQEVQALVDAVLPVLRDHNHRVRDVLDAILPPAALLGAGAAAQSRRNAVLRDSIAREHGLLGASDIAAAAGSRARNAAATATRWRSAGKIFSVPVGLVVLYPGFQFDFAGAPRPQIAAVLKVLNKHLSGWELAAWFTQPLDELDSRTPVEAMDDDLSAVLEAAAEAAASMED